MDKNVKLIIVSVFLIAVLASSMLFINNVISIDNKEQGALTGDVYVNEEPVAGAIVEVYDKDTNVSSQKLISRTYTDSSGEFRINNTEGGDYVSVATVGNYTVDGKPFHASDVKYINTSETFNFSKEEYTVEDINGSERAISFEGSNNGLIGNSSVGDVYMLQSISDKGNYELTRNIDAEPTERWNYIENYTTRELNPGYDEPKDLDFLPFYDFEDYQLSDDSLEHISTPRDSIIVIDIKENFTITLSVNDYKGFEPIAKSGKFTGSIDGNGFKINDLYLYRAEDNVGLISETENATIKNMRLNGNISGSYNSGSVAGRVGEGTVIKNMNIFTDVNNKPNADSAWLSGGVTGVNNGKISNVFVEVRTSVSNRDFGVVAHHNYGETSDNYYNVILNEEEYSSSIRGDRAADQSEGGTNIKDIKIDI